MADRRNLQDERRIYLIKALLKEQTRYSETEIPSNAEEQKRLLRSLFNVRMPLPVTEGFLKVQDEYLQEETKAKGITDIENLLPADGNLYLRQGDITALKCGAIVNAANSQMLGCFYPCHSCIDNQIHTYAGIQLRLACFEQMKRQGHEEETGSARLTPAFNLPCGYVLHTVGPIVSGRVTERDRERLVSCYRSCLKLAERHGIKSAAFCCISTGEFHFPAEEAAKIAVSTVREYIGQNQSEIKVIFNVFKDTDYEIYRELLGSD